MAKTASLPKTLYVVRNQPEGEDAFFIADEDLHSVVRSADESPVVVGAYKLMDENKYRETIEVVK
jgi:hypothetical protein